MRLAVQHERVLRVVLLEPQPGQTPQRRRRPPRVSVTATTAPAGAAASARTRPSSASTVRTGSHVPPRFHEITVRTPARPVPFMTVAMKVLSVDASAVTSNTGGSATCVPKQRAGSEGAGNPRSVVSPHAASL